MTTDRDLLKAQYRDGGNLDARIALHARFSTATTQFHDWLFNLITAPPDARVLEIGCGTGALWQQVYARTPRGWRLTLTDFSHGMAAGLRPKSQAWGFNARFAQCDVQALPFPDAHFDLVLANHMLYHVPDLARGVGEIARVLKPDGMLVAATNGEAHMRELDNLATEIGIPPHRIWQLAFRLENGAELLGRQFARVDRHDFADALVVTEAEPLIAYIVSMNTFAGLLTPENVARLRATVASRLARDGAIRIRKSTGVFIARAPRR
ncbi:MAG: class I SAM-dependent methyltransferase [Chloroflexi bacterium]|nr:class I SAM-dependent methyltransferase [Chloroflexota bacterium]